MPHYPVKNLKTGEEKELYMSMIEYTKWREENPDWDKDWVKGVGGGGPDCVGEMKTKLANRNPGWKEVLDKVGRACPKNKNELY